MADPKLPRSTDLLMKQSQETASDRAKRINSLHTHVDKIISDQNRENLHLSKETDSLGKQKDRLRRELDYARTDISNELSQDYNKVVKGLGATIQQMSIGMKNISISTARATTNAISQYGKAIGQDININKTNTVVMALAQATPLFGYFAAKFMETDVFQNAAKTIKNKIGGAMIAGMSMAGRKISGMFSRETPREKMAKREREIGALSSEISSLIKEFRRGIPKDRARRQVKKGKKEIPSNIPKMAEGGYVKKSGVVKVHAGEVVAPIGSIVKEIISNMHDSKQQAWQDQMLKALVDLKLVQIGTSSRLKLGLQRTIMENPAMRGMLMFAEGFKSVLGAPIKWLFGARGGYLSDVKRATSTSNVFLKVANLLGVLYTTAMPKLDAIAKYTRVSATVAAGYEPTPPLMDKYTMFQKVKGILKGKGKGKGLKGKGMDTILRMVGVSDDEITEFRKEGGLKGMFGLAKQGLEASKDPLKEGIASAKEHKKQGIESAKELLEKGKEAAQNKAFDLQFQARAAAKTLKHKGIVAAKEAAAKAKEVAENEAFDLEFKRRAAAKTLKHKGAMGIFGSAIKGAKGTAGSVAETTSSYFKRMTNYLKDLTKMKSDQEEREKPHSPSWVEYIGQTFHKAKERVKQGADQLDISGTAKKKAETATKFAKKHYEKTRDRGEKQFQEIKKNRKANEAQTGFLSGMVKRAKGLGKWIWSLLGMAYSVLEKIVGYGFSVLGTMLAPILLQLGISGLFRSGGPGFGAHARKAGQAARGAAGSVAQGVSQTGRVARNAGPKAAAKFAGKGAAKTALGGAKFGGRLVGNVAKVGGKLVGASLGGILGMASGGYDAYQAVQDPDFKGGNITKGVSGFVGGTDSGWSGAAGGALKGAGIGAMVGSFIPVLGTVIGGAIGAGAGGILGAIGGKRISGVIDEVTGPLKGGSDMVKAARAAMEKQNKKRTMDNYLEKLKEGEAGSRTNRYRLIQRDAGESEEDYKKREKTGMRFALGTLGATAGNWKNGLLTRARINDAWYEVVLNSQGGLKELLLSEDQTGTVLGKKLAEEEKSKRQAQADALQNQTDALKDKMGEGAEATVNATNVSSKNIVASTNNISNVKTGGGGPGNRGFGSGSGYASDVERCNIS